MDVISNLRQYRIYDMAIFDWSLALLGGYFIALLIQRYFQVEIPFISLLLIVEFGLILLGIASHKIFGIDTMLGYYLGLNQKPQRT